MAKGITVPVTQTGLEQSIQGAAKKVGSISIPIDVDAKSFKNLSQPLGRITGLATEFEKSIAASNARVIAFGASVGIINGVQNALASLVTTTIEVQKNLTSIGVIFGKTNEELSGFSKGLFAVARETAQSFQTASEAALEFSRQGLSTEETLKRTKDALTLTRFTSLSAADAVDVLTAAVNSFSSSGVTTAEILNKLVAVDTRFAVSSEDLAKGLSRAGSIAQEVGVSLDELNGIVTVVQEKTARGGAVIGNAFKTIFTRIRSNETINALQEIGIFSRDASGNLRPVVDILTQLAGKLNGLSEIQKIEVLEAIASKYNINSLNALLDDLGSSASKFQEIAGISANANNEAYSRQVELNKTLDATIKQTVVSVAELANSIGEIGVTANLQSLLEFFNDIISGINSFIDSESIGGDIAKGLISGISGVLFKIGLPILGAIFIKLTKDIAQFGVESLKTILGINQQVKERQALEQAVVNTLIRDRDVMAAILALSGDRTKQEEYLLNLYNRQIAALQQVQSIAGAVAPGLVQAGLSATSGSVQKKAGRAAEGYLPAQEAADVKRGVGGADKNAKVVKIPNFSFGGGKKGTMYANSSEYVVPNYNGGDGSAIFNKDMVRKYGMPENAKKINAATGYIPNFAQKIQAETSEAQAEQRDSITIADARGRSAMLVPDKKNERIMEAYLDKPLSFGFQTKDKGKKLGVDYVKYHTYGLNQEAFKAEGLKKSGDLTNIEADVQAFGLDIAKKYSYEYAGEYSKSLGGPATGIQISDTDVRKAFLASKGAVSGFSSLGGGIFETAIRTGVQGEINKDLLKAQQAELGSGKLDFKVTDIIKRLFGVNRGETDADSKIEGNPKSTGRAFADQIAANNLYSSTSKVAIQNAAAGYIPNYIKNQPKNIKAIREGNKFERYLNLKLFGQEEDAGSAVLDFPKKTGFGKDPEIRKKLGINPVSQYGDAKRTRSKKSEKSLLDKYLRTEEGEQEFLKAQPLGKLINLNPAGLSMLFLNEGQDSKSFAKVETTEAILSEKTKELIKQKFPNTRASKIITMSYIADKINKDAVFDKKAARGYIPNYAETLSEMYDWDGTIIPRMAGKPEEYIQSLQKLEKKDLLPIGKELASSKEKFDIATARPILFREPIKQTAKRLGLNVEKIFPLGSMFENRRTMGVKGKPRKLYGPERKALFAEKTNRSIVDNQEDVLAALGSRGIDANLRNRASFGFIPNFASQNAIDAMRRIISDPAAPQGEKDAASLKLSQLTKVSSLNNPRVAAQKTTKIKVPITQEDKDYLNQNKEKIVAGMGRSFGMLFNLDALEMGDLGYVKRLDPIVAKKLSEIAQKQGGRDSIRSLVDFGSAAKGYIPNFADPLKEAVDREISAGIKPSQVRVTQDDRLMTSRNPEGIAVINTRDEPNGKVPSNRINEKNGRKAAVAMAAKGFIPNFAGEGKQKLDISNLPLGLNEKDLKSFRVALAEVTIKFSQTNKTVEEINNASTDLKSKIIEIANQYKIGADKQGAITKKADELIEARKNLATKTIAGGDGAGGGTTPPKGVGGAASGGGSAIPPLLEKGKAPKREFDAGKFLLFQSAIVGATSAIQSFTDETSNAALGLEFATGAVQGAITGFLIPGGAFVKVLTGLIAAGTSLIPAFAKLNDKLKTEEDRLIDSLAKLGEEARKTGESVSPQKFLAAFEQEQKRIKESAKTQTVTQTVKGELGKRASFASVIPDKEVDALTAAFQAAGITTSEKISEYLDRVNPATGEGFVKSREKTFTEKALVSFATSASPLGTLAGLAPGSPLSVNSKVKSISPTSVVNDLRMDILDEAEKRENSIAAARTQAELEKDKIAQRTVALENQQILNKLKIQQSIFNLEQDISEEYFYRNQRSEYDLNILERQKATMTESAYLQQKFAIDRAKIQTNSIREQQEAAVKLKSEFSGFEGGLGNILGGLNIDQLKQVAAQLNPEQIKRESESGAPGAGAGAVGLIKKFAEGSGISASAIATLNNLSKEQREIILKAVQGYAQTLSTTAKKTEQQNSALSENFMLSETAVQKQAREIEDLTKIYAGAGDYQDRLSLAKGELTRSVLNLKIKNKIEADSADQFISTEKERLDEELNHIETMRERFPIAQRAAISEKALVVETEKKIDAIDVDIKTTETRLEQERRLVAKNNEKVKAENKAYNSFVRQENISLKLEAAREALTKSLRDADEQNQVAIAMVRENFDADMKGLDQKLALAKAVNREIEQADYDLSVSKELSLEKQNLIVAQRKAIGQLNNLSLGIDNFVKNFQTGQIQEFTKTLTEGRGYAEMGLGAGTLEAQAKAAVAERRLLSTGKKFEELSASEQYSITTGRGNSVSENASIAGAGLLDQAQTFQDIIGKQAPQLFADGMAQAMDAALNQADDLGSALRGIAMSFLKSMQSAFLQSASKQIVGSIMPQQGFSRGGIIQGYATGGLVTGGSGYKDDVPAMLSEGEYVIRKSSVQKYGKDNLTKLNSGKMPTMADGGFFLPGFRGQESISGIENLKKFSEQTTTSGATDVMKGSASSAFINLEDQSMKLSRFALLGDDTINQEIRDAQQSALDAIEKRRQYDLQKQEEKKQFKRQIISTVASAALSYGIGQLAGGLGNAASVKSQVIPDSGGIDRFDVLGSDRFGPTTITPVKPTMTPYVVSSSRPKIGRAYGGEITRYAAGGGTKDDVPALLMGGEYVMSNQATKKYGKQFFDSINQGRAPRFANGGEVGGGEMLGEKFDNLSSKLETRGAPEVNITVNVTSSGGSETKAQGESNQGGIDYKKMSERIKAVVIETINEEKRLGGSLRPRG